jgi:uncharacterized membrane protein YhhN
MTISLLFLSILGLAITGISTVVSYREGASELKIKNINNSVLIFLGMLGVVHSGLFGVAIVWGLIFSAIGDYFLTKAKSYKEGDSDKNSSFIIGLACYMIGYLFYGINFLIYGKLNIGTLISFILFSLISLIQYFTMNKDKIKGMKLPILIYFTQAIILMSGASSILVAQNFSLQGIFILLGSLSLFTSDSFIGHKLFRAKNTEHLELIITPTYIIGQMFIIMSLFLMGGV